MVRTHVRPESLASLNNANELMAPVNVCTAGAMTGDLSYDSFI